MKKKKKKKKDVGKYLRYLGTTFTAVNSVNCQMVSYLFLFKVSKKKK